MTESSPVASPAFFREAGRRKAAWCTRLNRAIGTANRRRAIRASEDVTVALVYRGTLIVDGPLYLTGCWPDQSPKPGRLETTPFQSRTVPPDFLGLKASGGGESIGVGER